MYEYCFGRLPSIKIEHLALVIVQYGVRLFHQSYHTAGIVRFHTLEHSLAEISTFLGFEAQSNRAIVSQFNHIEPLL